MPDIEQRVTSKNNLVGGVQRGWLVHTRGRSWFVDEGYGGESAVKDFWDRVGVNRDDVVIMPRVYVGPSEYNRIKQTYEWTGETL